jgi:hypothetical protein
MGFELDTELDTDLDTELGRDCNGFFEVFSGGRMEATDS